MCLAIPFTNSLNFSLCLYSNTNPATKAAIAATIKTIGLASNTRFKAACATATNLEFLTQVSIFEATFLIALAPFLTLVQDIEAISLSTEAPVLIFSQVIEAMFLRYPAPVLTPLQDNLAMLDILLKPSFKLSNLTKAVAPKTSAKSLILLITPAATLSPNNVPKVAVIASVAF